MKKIRVGITGDKLYEDRYKIKEFIFALKSRLQGDIEIIGLGDLNGADKHIRKYALELGYNYKEANLPHTQKNLYSLMSESFHNRPYAPRNTYVRDKIYASYIDLCVLFDTQNPLGRKCANILKEINKLKKNVVVIS